jgi:hypothetical protein
MKYLFTLFLIVGLTSFAHSQSYSDGVDRSKGRAVYLEVLGNGFGYSLNYDQRFQNRFDGLGFKAGGSYLAIDGTSVATFPLGINYLLGSQGKYFEMGLGTTYILASGQTNIPRIGKERTSGNLLVGNMTLGYRSEPVNGGFVFRASITPFFGYGIFWPIYGGLSVGYAF